MNRYELFAATFKVPKQLYFVEQRGMHYVRGAVAADTDTHVHLCRMAVDFDRMWTCWEKGWSARESVGDLAEAMVVPRVGPEVSFVVEDQPPFCTPPTTPPRELLERLVSKRSGHECWDALEPDRLAAVAELRTWLEENP